MDESELHPLLSRMPLPLETGWERSPAGVLHVAARTDLHGCTGEMLDWWFRSRCDTERYVWWHPIDHVSSTWAGDPDPATVIGAEHVVVERLTELPPTELLIQFRDPSEFFEAGELDAARRRGDLSCVVTGRTGLGHEPDRDVDGAVLGGRLFHIGRDTDWGLALRSHFFLGSDLARAGAGPDEVAATAPDLLAPQLLQHTYNEFVFLSRFLPALHAAENRNDTMPSAPW